MAQMAEEHGHELRPTGETLGAFLGPVLPHLRISEQIYHSFRLKITTDFGSKLPPISV